MASPPSTQFEAAQPLVNPGEELYRIRVTLTNVGVLENRGEGSAYLCIDEPNQENSLCGFSFTGEMNRSAIWRFNRTPDGRYTIACNVGQYIGHKSEDRDADDEIVANNSYLPCRSFEINYENDATTFSLVSDGEYLSVNGDGKLVFSDTPGEYSRWTMSRAYPESLDLPKFSTDENPVYYVLDNKSAGYMKHDNNRLRCGSLSKESYWYFVESGSMDGSFYIKNKEGNLSVQGNTQNGYMNVEETENPITIMFYMLEGNEDNGWSMTFRHHNLSTFTKDNQLTLCYISSWKWIQGTSPSFQESADQYSWRFIEANVAADQALIEAKEDAVSELKAYKSYSPWCHQLLDDAVVQIESVNRDSFESPEDAIAEIVRLKDESITAYYLQLAREARGNTVKISNMRRRSHENAAETGWYICSKETDGIITVNTTSTPDYSGIWDLEPVESNESTFRIRNQNGVYICEPTNGQTVKTTYEASEAGEFWLYPYANALRFMTVSNVSLNLDTAGSDLVGYAYNDAGSTWTFESVTVIKEGKPDVVLSTDEEKQLYIIRSAADPDDILMFDDDGIALTHGALGEGSYCYFYGSNDFGDGIQIESQYYGTRLYYSYPFFWNTKDGWKTDKSFNLYMVKNGEEGQNSYVISYCYPPTETSCLSRLSIDPDHQYFTGLGSPDDVENTSWIPEPVAGVDHELIFNSSRRVILDEIVSYKNAVPWAQDLFEEVIDYISGCKMTDFAPQSTEAVANLKMYYNDALVRIEERLEIEPDGDWVTIANVRRSGENGIEYLAVAEDGLNTVGELSDKAIWQLVYVSNGRYHLCNAEGWYIGTLGEQVPVTTNESEAGLYMLDLAGGYLRLADRNNPSTRTLNLDAYEGMAGVASASDPGSAWTCSLTINDNVKEIGEETVSGKAVYYNISGARVQNGSLAPGVYVRVKDGSACKVIVK